MLKQNKKTIIWSTVLIFLPMLAGLCLWSVLPAQLPVHWNFEGIADGYSSKAFAVFGINSILLICHLIIVLLTAADPKKQNIQGKMLTFTYWLMPVFGVLLNSALYAVALGVQLNMTEFIMASVGVLFVFWGNWMPKIQPNYTMGIKLPWTLDNDENWRKTHRMAGPVWIAGGVLTIIAPFLGKYGLAFYLVVLVFMVLIPVIYSFCLYRKTN